MSNDEARMTKPDEVTIALVQMSCTSDKQANVAKALDRIADAASQGAEVVCLQELFHGLYPCQSEDHARFAEAEPIPGPTSTALAESAKKHGVVIVGSIFERRAAGVYHNTAVVFDADGRQAGLYRKMHIPDDPLYYEKFYFTPGDLGFPAFDTRAARIGALVCWDQWYPEGARLSALAGAEALLYPTAIGWHPAEKDEVGAAQRTAWQVIQRAHAIANGVYVAVANRVGHEGPADAGLEFWGSSFVSDPFGVVLAEAPADEEAVLVVACDRRHQEDVRRNWPFLRDRRIDAYGDIGKRFLS
jgi:N-carbamoylputrescine amidase